MTATLLSPGGRATIVEAAEGVARAELGSDDVTVVEIVDGRPEVGVRRRVAVVGPATTSATAAPPRPTTLHARLDRALRVRGLSGLDATHVLAPTPAATGASPDDVGSAATRRLSVVHALLVEGPAASPSGFTAFRASGPCARSWSL